MSASYWDEAVAIAFEEADAWSAYAGLTKEQQTEIAESLQGSHENYGMAHYSPPSSDRLNVIEAEWKAKYAALEREFEAYRGGAEKAVGRALRQHSDANISITKDGDVFRHGGRTEQLA